MPASDPTPGPDELMAAATELLGAQAPTPGSSIGAYVAALASRVEADDDSSVSPEQERHLADLASARARWERPFDALRAVDRATARLAEFSAPDDILAAAPRELGQIADIRQVVLGRVRNGTLIVHGSFVRDDPAATAALQTALRSEIIELKHPFAETEVLRRRRAVLVDALNDPHHVHPHLLATTRWSAFVVAPVIVAGNVIAILYADEGASDLAATDRREIVVQFSAELARIYETAQLRRAIRTERDETQRFARWLETRSRELTMDGESLAGSASSDAPPSEPARRAGTDAITFGGVLTRREVEVLQQLSLGHSNRRIATDLFLSPATVKSHVYRILNKLDVANRAEAVALYLGRTEPRATQDRQST